MTTMTTKFWSTPDARIQRIYVADGFIECKYVGGRDWADSVEYRATVAPEIVSALATRLQVAPEVNNQMFERFSEEQFGYASLGKKECARRRRNPITITL